MFRIVARRLTRQSQRRFATTSFPKPDLKPVNDSFFKDFNDKAAYPVAAFTIFVLSMAATKLAFFETKNPAFDVKHKGYTEFIENEKKTQEVKDWNSSVWRTGIHKLYAPFESEPEILARKPRENKFKVEKIKRCETRVA